MNLYKIETGNFKLDGGAIFGVVPKTLWNKVYPADENNLCNMPMRCLLVEAEDRLILIDTGIGNKQDDKFFSYYFLNGDDSMEKSFNTAGFDFNAVTDVILTHLHFDHVGGAVEKDSATNKLKPTFKNAKYWVSKAQWDWAMKPNQREKASFLKENIAPLEEYNQIHFIKKEGDFNSEIYLKIVNGHTQGLVVPMIKFNGRTLVYMADFIPTSAHISSSWICGYDTQPLESMQEKKQFLEEACLNNYTLFFEHDSFAECCTLKETEKGIKVDKIFSLTEFLNQ